MPTITSVNGKDLKKAAIEPTKFKHAEAILLERYTLPVSFSIDAWPCLERCHKLLKQSARKVKGGGNITVTIEDSLTKNKKDAYALDFGLVLGALGRITYTPTNINIESPVGTIISSYPNTAANDDRSI
ncbi:MAG: hypothetical protein ABI378_10005 [Chitinophagaceae bacterium]